MKILPSHKYNFCFICALSFFFSAFKILANNPNINNALLDKVAVAGAGEDMVQIGLHIAMHRGYFSDINLVVDIVKDDRQSAVSLILDEKVDFMFIRSDDLLKQRGFGYPLVAVASVMLDNQVYLAYKSDIEFNGIDSLQDKVWGILGNNFENQLIEDVFSNAGLNAEQFTKQPILDNDLVGAFKNGVDFVFVSRFWEGINAKLSGLSLKFVALDELDQSGKKIHFPTWMLASREDFIVQNPGIISRFILALATANNWLIKNPDKAATILSAKFPHLSRELLIKGLHEYVNILSDNQDNLGMIDFDQFNQLAKSMIHKGLIPPDYTAKAVFSNTY